MGRLARANDADLEAGAPWGRLARANDAGLEAGAPWGGGRGGGYTAP